MWYWIKKNIILLLISITLPLLVGTFSALITRDNFYIYNEIIKAPISPPSLVFPLVWTILYILMGISFSVMYSSDSIKSEKLNCFYFYYVSLIVNFFWSIIFFKQRLFLFAFVWLLLLVYLVLRTAICYRKLAPLACYLQIPYIFWLFYAGYLTLGAYILN